MTTESLLERARRGDADAFASLVEPHRRELLVHCYRMAGTLEDAEDLLQDTFLKAWLALNRYESRASLRTWLYRIATNACLDLLKSAPRRRLTPLTPLLSEVDVPSLTPDLDTTWINPLPDSWWLGAAAETEAAFSLRESVSLAFVTMIQQLPARQRAILLLCDVLSFSAIEAAEFVGATPSAVNSALLRARRALRQADRASLTGVAEDDQRLLDQYLAAWTDRDIPRLLQLINHDAIIAMPPMSAWYRGRLDIAAFYRSVVFPAAEVRWAARAIRANGQPALAVYHADGPAFCLQVLTPRAGGIQQIIFFIMPELFPAFRLPSNLSAGPGA